MKIYIAGHDRKTAMLIANQLIENGHTITSRWLLQPFKRTKEYSRDERGIIASMDVDDVVSADALLLIASKGMVPGGKFVEAGVALGHCMPVYLVGRVENMLLWHPLVEQISSLQEIPQ